ncbi:pyridoxamine 5'-phosphate oxidase family protein [Mycobacterium sp. 050134]|uniref:pyridoxamine 5'-phosphate oxidase family protein n=1 Tax=Mycobacterium sp. 050134 TaxID=3096111 RepID=UPI002ED88477
MITRDVDPNAVADLAISPPRAALAVTRDDGILLLPVRLGIEEPAVPASSPYVVRVPAGTPNLAGHNVVVIADDGPQWFRLRSLTVRGIAEDLGAGAYRVVPRRVVAWDYGSLRGEAAPSQASEPRPAAVPVGGAGDDRSPFRSPNLDAALSSSRVMILATRSRAGTPFAVPLWFVTHRGRLYATTSASSWTVRNVAMCPQVAVLLGGERQGDDRRLLVRGHARAVPGMPPPEVLARIAWRYYLTPRFAAVELSRVRQWALRARYYRQSRAAYVVVEPGTATESRAPSITVS